MLYILNYIDGQQYYLIKVWTAMVWQNYFQTFSTISIAAGRLSYGHFICKRQLEIFNSEAKTDKMIFAFDMILI